MISFEILEQQNGLNKVTKTFVLKKDSHIDCMRKRDIHANRFIIQCLDFSLSQFVRKDMSLNSINVTSYN